MLQADVTFRARYGETDQMGVIYYAVYIDWFSQGRVEFFRQASLPYVETFEEKGLHLAVTRVECSYHRPTYFDDEVTVRTRLASVTRTRMAFAYEVVKGSQCVATGTTEHAYFDAGSARAVDLRKWLPEFWEELAHLTQD